MEALAIKTGFPAAQDAALEAYANRDFAEAVHTMNDLLEGDPGSARYHEMRAQVWVQLCSVLLPDASRPGAQQLSHGQ